jgi:hypothetical protein
MNEREILVVEMSFYVPQASTAQIVENTHFNPAIHESIDKVAAYEPSTTCD